MVIQKISIRAKKPQVRLSIEGGNFIRLTQDLINFGYGGLPEDVHFSLSSHPNNPLANFHITRETNDPANKPQIRIFEIKKSDLKLLELRLAKVVLENIYQPMSIPYQQWLSRKDFYKRVGFIAFDDLERSQSGAPSIWDKSKLKGGKLKISEAGIAALEVWAAKPMVQQRLAKQLLTLPWRPYRRTQNGYLISPAHTGCVLIIDGVYYKQRETIDLIAILNEILGEQQTQNLIAKTVSALNDIQAAVDWQDSQQYSQPFQLIF